MQKLVDRVQLTQALRAFCTNIEANKKRIEAEKINDNFVNKSKTTKYAQTILPPKTDFPRSAKYGTSYSKDALEYATFKKYQYEWQQHNLQEPEFILHDGPPYANGSPHMGHALNKILKDFVLRHHMINGRKVHYVPGFDCHGLPIEITAVKGLSTKTPSEVRSAARAFAYKYIIEQSTAFSNWWVLAKWTEQGCYHTHKLPYIKKEMQYFVDLFQKGFIYRDFKPVHWSPSSRTALAESELLYRDDHLSLSAYIRFQLNHFPPELQKYRDQNVYAIIWTTTPWTLLANQAISFSPNLTYCIVEWTDSNLYILAEERINDLRAQIGEITIIQRFLGKCLETATYIHPMNGECMPFLAGDYITESSGSGLVHTAPAHGKEDFLLGLKHKIQIKSLVDETGCYTHEAGEYFQGVNVLTEGSEKVLERLGSHVLKVSPFRHSYPYDWRTNEPILTRASHQWFIDIESIKDKALEELQKVEVYPPCNKESLINGLIVQIEKRPFWCISRQRLWGTPIPAFYDKETNEPIVNRELVNILCDQMDRHGTDIWWNKPLQQIIPPEAFAAANLDPNHLRKGKDILDIWFDSGVSWGVVLPENNKVADLYLEGMDQMNGWFQSSLITSIALQNQAPYKAIFVHGIAVDKKGRKMSKSEGNGVSPDDIINGSSDGKFPAYGIDTLRWWVASHGTQHLKVPVTKQMFDIAANEVSKLRAIFYFLLGALTPCHLSYKSNNAYHAIDKYMLHQLYEYDKKIWAHFGNYEFHHVTKAAINFVAAVLSPVYIPIIKDRLYCDGANSHSRAAVVDVMRNVLTVLVRSVAPIVPALAEEVFIYHPERIRQSSLFYTTYSTSRDWVDPFVAENVQTALSIKRILNKLDIKKHALRTVTINATESDFAKLSALQSEETSTKVSNLCEIMECTNVALVKCPKETETTISWEKIDAVLCLRCRKYIAMDCSELCKRCANTIS